MSKKLFGRATIRVDGKTYDTKKGSTLDLGGVKRTPREGSNSSGNYTEELMGSKLETVILFGVGDSAAEVNAITDATIAFEADTGQTYVIRGGYAEGNSTLTEGEGELKTVFYGPAAEEML